MEPSSYNLKMVFEYKMPPKTAGPGIMPLILSCPDPPHPVSGLQHQQAQKQLHYGATPGASINSHPLSQQPSLHPPLSPPPPPSSSPAQTPTPTAANRDPRPPPPPAVTSASGPVDMDRRQRNARRKDIQKKLDKWDRKQDRQVSNDV